MIAVPFGTLHLKTIGNYGIDMLQKSHNAPVIIFMTKKKWAYVTIS